MSEKSPGQKPREGLRNLGTPEQEQSPKSLELALIDPENPKFVEIRELLISQSGCPDIEKSPEEFAKWLEQARTFQEYLGYLATTGKVDPYGFLQGREGGINDLSMLAKNFGREKKYTYDEIIERAFAYIKEQTNTPTPRLRLNPNRTYDEQEIKNLRSALNPQNRNFWLGFSLENRMTVYLQLDQSQLQSLTEWLKQWLKEAQVEDQPEGVRISGLDPLVLSLFYGKAVEADFAGDKDKYGQTFVPSVEIRPLAYGLRHHEIPSQPYTEPPVNGLYKKPAALTDGDLGWARCDQQILILLAALDKAKVPIVITFRSGSSKNVSNIEAKE